MRARLNGGNACGSGKVWSYCVIVTQASVGPAAGVELVEPVDGERAHDLPHPVAAIVEEEHAVAVPHRGDRHSVRGGAPAGG